MLNFFNIPFSECPEPHAVGHVEVDQTMQRAVEKLLDMEHEAALRFFERLRKRIVQVEKEGSPSFSSSLLSSQQVGLALVMVDLHLEPRASDFKPMEKKKKET